MTRACCNEKSIWPDLSALFWPEKAIGANKLGDLWDWSLEKWKIVGNRRKLLRVRFFYSRSGEGAAGQFGRETVKAIKTQAKVQIMSLARTLSRSALIFLLDEPTSHMSRHATQITIDIIKELQQDGATFILTSHQPEFISSLCSEIWTIEQQCLHITS